MWTWTIESALPVVRLVEQVVIPIGAHAAIGGSVIMRGASMKDLDIFIYPHKTQEWPSVHLICEVLERAGFDTLKSRDHKSYGDGKCVFASAFLGQQVDFFLL